MVNLNSTLYNEHPDWVLHAGKHARTLTRSQLILNVGLSEVQNFIIESVSKILDSGAVSYVKWDNNRGMHELARPSRAQTQVRVQQHSKPEYEKGLLQCLQATAALVRRTLHFSA